MLPKHFYAKADGYLRREYKQSADMRRLGYFIIIPHVDTKKVTFDYQTFCRNYWPISYEQNIVDEDDTRKTPEEEYKEQKQKYLEIMRAHNKRRYHMIIGKQQGN